MKDLTHPQAQEWIEIALNAGLNPENQQELDAHLATCPECQAYARRLASLDSRLKDHILARWPEQPFALTELQSRMASIHHQVRRKLKMKRVWITLQPVAWTAAAVFLVVLLGWTFTRLRPAPAAFPATPVTITPAVVPTETATPDQGSTPDDSTLPPSPTGLPPDWKTYTSTRFQITLSYPDSWQPGPEVDQFSGTDGFFKLSEALPSYRDFGRLCETVGNSGEFGQTPQILVIAIADRNGCQIATSLNRANSNGSLAIFPADSFSSPPFIQLYADPVHFQPILGSISFANSPLPTPAFESVPISTPDPAQSPALIQPVISESGGLTIEAYPVVSSDVDTPSHVEFNQRIPEEVFTKRAAWRTALPPLDQVNPALQPFGFELKPKTEGSPDNSLFDLYQGETLLQANIIFYRRLAVNGSGTNFALVLELQGGNAYLLTKAGIEPWDSSLHAYVPPVYAGDRLITAEMDMPAGNMPAGNIRIKQDGQTAFTFSVMGPIFTPPIEGLWEMDGHWFAEIDGFLIVDGRNINTETGIEEIFGFEILAGKPFYFFVQDQTVKISYGGDLFPADYQEVIHGMCCEPAAFNIKSNSSMVWFYALKDNVWQYVEIGVYNTH